MQTFRSALWSATGAIDLAASDARSLATLFDGMTEATAAWIIKQPSRVVFGPGSREIQVPDSFIAPAPRAMAE